MLLQIQKKILTLTLILNGPSKFLSIQHQIHSNSPFYWNMNSVNTRSNPNCTKYILDYTRYIPKDFLSSNFGWGRRGLLPFPCIEYICTLQCCSGMDYSTDRTGRNTGEIFLNGGGGGYRLWAYQ